MTIAIVSIAVVALLGGVLATTTASATGRNMTTVDSVLKSFAEAARYDIQTQAPDGSSGPQYLPCAAASDYKVISAPYPSSGAPLSVVTVFATGFTPSVGTGVTFTSTTTPSVTGSSIITTTSPPVNPSSGAMVTFAVPGSLPIGKYTIAPFGTHDLAAGEFTVTGGLPSNGSAFQGYQLSASIQYWTGSGWSSNQANCAQDQNSNLQQLSYQLVDTQTGNGATGSASFVVADFTPLPVPSLVVQCTTDGSPCDPLNPYQLGTQFTFTATLSQFTGSLTGSITWTLPAGDSCSPPQPDSVPPVTASCTISAALAGTLDPVAVYSGDATHSGVAASLGASITVNKGTLWLAVNGSGKLVQESGTDLQFSVNIGGIVAGVPPANPVQLTLTASGQHGNSTCSGPFPISGNSPPPVATCTVDDPSSGSYTVTATYPGDANYNGPVSASYTIFVENIVTLTYSPPVPVVGHSFTVTATVNQPAGGPAPQGGTITWSGINVPASCTPAQVPPTSVTCTVPNAAPTPYIVTATYSGDTNYAGASASIYVAAPSLTCNGCRLRRQGGSFTVTATITPPFGGPAPTGTVTWNVSGNATSCTSTTPLQDVFGTYMATCTIANDVRGTYNFSVTYGDSNYIPETSAVLRENVR